MFNFNTNKLIQLHIVYQNKNNKSTSWTGVFHICIFHNIKGDSLSVLFELLIFPGAAITTLMTRCFKES